MCIKNVPNDLKILSTIYIRYYDTFKSFSVENKTRETKIYVPIDLMAIAKELDIDVDIIYGRLYYYLNNKYSYKQSDGSRVDLFALLVGKDTSAINFPYLASILAELQDKEFKYRMTTIVAILALVIAIASLLLSIFS